MTPKCMFPHCARNGTHLFSQVPLCEDHESAIRLETGEFGRGGFYGGKTANKQEADARPLYYQIDHLISHSKRSLKGKNGDLI